MALCKIQECAETCKKKIGSSKYLFSGYFRGYSVKPVKLLTRRDELLPLYPMRFGFSNNYSNEMACFLKVMKFDKGGVVGAASLDL